MAVVKRNTYSTEEVERGLIAIAYADGNSYQAARDLSKDGVKIPRATLQNWKDKVHADRYAAIRKEVLPDIRAKAAEAHLALAGQQTKASLQITEELVKELDKLSPRDKTLAMAKLDVGSGIHSEKGLLFEGQPTEIIRRDSATVLRELAAEGVDLTKFDFDAEVVTEEDVLQKELAP